MDGLRAEVRVCEVFFRRVTEHTLDLRADVGEGGVLDLLHIRYSGELLDQRTVAFLAHDQGLFGLLALCQVYNGGHPDTTPRIRQVPWPYLYRKNGAVLFEAPRLVVSGVLVGDTLPHHLPVLRRCELDGVFPDQFLETVPEHLGNATVGVDDLSVLAQDYSLDDLLGDRDKVAWLVRLVVHQGDGQVDPDAPPALADDELLLGIVPELPRKHPDAPVEVSLDVLGGDELEDAHRAEFLAIVTYDVAELVVEPEPFAIQPDLHDPDGGLLEGCPEAFLTPPELLLGPLLLGDVVLDAEPVQRIAVLIPDERRLVAHPHHPPVAGDLAVFYPEGLTSLVGPGLLGKHPFSVVGMQHP